jgi:hypothetical protein
MEIPDIVESELAYRRQYYDAGEASTMKCRFCGQGIRQVFLLKDPHNNAIPIGPCCFSELKEANPTAYAELVASLVLLRGYVRDAGSDGEEQRKIAEAQAHKLAYKTLCRAARTCIRTYRQTSGEKDWLPKPFFELRKELRKKPRKDYRYVSLLARWYSTHAASLQGKLDSCHQ